MNKRKKRKREKKKQRKTEKIPNNTRARAVDVNHARRDHREQQSTFTGRGPIERGRTSENYPPRRYKLSVELEEIAREGLNPH